MKCVTNDQFYTKQDVANKCIKCCLPFKYDTIIEPSAGCGSFSKLLPNSLAYDLDPKDEKIEKQDFLKLNFNSQWGKKILFIGNPPFGKRSLLAKKFIKHAIELNATTIAFILPDTFRKSTNQKFTLFPKQWNLIKINKLPDNSFFVFQNNKKIFYHVPCSFFIWTKNENLKKRFKNLRILPSTKFPKEFKFLKRGDKNADFVINGNTGKVKNVSEVSNPKAEHYIYINERNKQNIKKMKRKFEKLKFDHFSSVNGGNYWINQNEIITKFYMNYD